MVTITFLVVNVKTVAWADITQRKGKTNVANKIKNKYLQLLLN